jgi:hypothetical protein
MKLLSGTATVYVHEMGGSIKSRIGHQGVYDAGPLSRRSLCADYSWLDLSHVRPSMLHAVVCMGT